MAQASKPTEGQGTGKATPTQEPHPPTTQPPNRGADIEQVLDSIFLTPRVVDQRGFEELAGSLRGLTHEAATRHHALASTSAEVSRLNDSLRQATHELHTRLESAAKIMPSLDERVEKASGLITQAGAQLDDRLREIKDIARDDFKIDRERIAQRVREQVTGVVASLVEDQLRSAGQRLGQSIDAELSRLREEGARIGGETLRIREGIIKAGQEAARLVLENVTNDAAALLEKLDQSRGLLSAALGAANDRASTIFEETRERLATLGKGTIEHLEQVTRKLEQKASVSIDQARSIAEGIDQTCDAAAVRLGALADRACERVQAGVERAESAAASAGKVEGEIREGAQRIAREAALSVREQIGDVLAGAHEDLRRAREAALDTIEQAGSTLDDLSRRTREEIAIHAARGVEEARGILEQVEEATLTQNAMREVIGQFQDRVTTTLAEQRADLDEAMTHARRRIEQAAQGPASLIESLDRARAGAAAEIADAAASLDAFVHNVQAQHQAAQHASEQIEMRLRTMDLTVIATRLTDVLERSQHVEDLARTAAQAATHADTALKSIESYKAQADQARRQLGDAIVSGASKVDTIEADLDALAARVDQVRAGAGAPLTPLTPDLLRQAGELATRLATLVGQANMMGEGLNQLLALAAEAQAGAKPETLRLPDANPKPASRKKPKAG